MMSPNESNFYTHWANPLKFQKANGIEIVIIALTLKTSLPMSILLQRLPNSFNSIHINLNKITGSNILHSTIIKFQSICVDEEKCICHNETRFKWGPDIFHSTPSSLLFTSNRSRRMLDSAFYTENILLTGIVDFYVLLMGILLF